MIKLRRMSEIEFEQFKALSQKAFASSLAAVENVALEIGLKNASEQFDRLVPMGLSTPGQLFFEAIEDASENSVGYLWLGIQERLGRKIASINDIYIRDGDRGKGFGKALMKLVEHEANKVGAIRIRLHVFQNNETARRLYLSMGFRISSMDMVKEV